MNSEHSGVGHHSVNDQLLVLLALLTCPDETVEMKLLLLSEKVAVKKVRIQSATVETDSEVFSTIFLWCFSRF